MHIYLSFDTPFCLLLLFLLELATESGGKFCSLKSNGLLRFPFA